MTTADEIIMTMESMRDEAQARHLMRFFSRQEKGIMAKVTVFWDCAVRRRGWW